MFNCKSKRIIKLVLILLVLCFAFSGCGNIFNVLKAEQVEYEDAVKHRTYYMSEVEKLMSSKGYAKNTDNSYSWVEMYGYSIADVYELDNDSIFMCEVARSEGEEFFLLAVFSSSEEVPDKSAVKLPLVSEVLDIISGYDISLDDLNEFCDNAKYNDETGVYKNYKSLDYYEYYDLYYISTESSVVPDTDKYNNYLSITGLTKTGLKQK